MFSAPQDYSVIALTIAAYGFAVQIYCDFSGYTDMARGISKMMGINLTLNFNFPYFAQGFRDFWRRWHITLSSWFRDYVYIPLGGNRGTINRTMINLLVTFFLSGLWHGAGWNFILWGVFHGVLVAAEHLLEKTSVGRWVSSWPALLKIICTFHLVVLGWVLFRSQGLDNFILFFQSLTTLPPLESPTAIMSAMAPLVKFCIFVAPLIIFDFVESRADGKVWEASKGALWQGVFYGLIIFCLILFSATDGKQFIYFQF